MNPFVITGCGRSGTMGMARLLLSHGIRTSFEEFFHGCAVPKPQGYCEWLLSTGTSGEVSGLAPPYLPNLDSGVVVLHQVRNPVAVIASLMGLRHFHPKSHYYANVKFNFRYCREMEPFDDPLTLCMKYWLCWNMMIEPWAACRYRVEDVAGDEWGRIAARLSSTPLHEPIEQYSQSHNSSTRDTSIWWSTIPDGNLKTCIRKKAEAYGYTIDDLESYSPIDVDIRHEFPRLMRPITSDGYLAAGLAAFYRHVADTGRNSNGVEVGCYGGESTEIAAQFMKALVCIDNWGPGFEGGQALFDARTARFSHVEKRVLTSVNGAGTVADGTLDVVYIDAMHDYGNVKQDILAWFPKVRMGGYIAGHDYDGIETHAGVVRAVNEILGKPEMSFVDSSWLFEKTPELAGRVEKGQI